MTLFIGGNSHVGALKNAHDKDPQALNGAQFVPFGTGQNLSVNFVDENEGVLQFKIEKMMRLFERITGRDYFAPSDHWAVLLANPVAVFRTPFWGRCTPSTIHAPTKRPIPVDVVNAVFEQYYAPKFDFYTRALDHGIKITAISCPPIRRDHPLFERKKRLSNESALELERIGRDIHEEFLQRSGIPFVSVPAEVKDARGFLKDEFAQKVSSSGKRDPHHANELYGSLMLKKIASELAS